MRLATVTAPAHEIESLDTMVNVANWGQRRNAALREKEAHLQWKKAVRNMLIDAATLAATIGGIAAILVFVATM